MKNASAIGSNLNDVPTTRAMFCLLYTAGTLVYFALPAWGSIFSELYGFSNVQVGWLLSADMLTNALANISARYWIYRYDWRRLVLLLVAANVATNIACMGTTSFDALMVLRYLAGFSGGALVSLAVAGIGATSKPDSNFGYALSLQVFFGGFLLFFTDKLVQQYGTDSLYLVVSVPVLLCVALIHAMPKRYQHPVPSQPQGEEATIDVPKAGVSTHTLYLGMAFIAVFIFFTGMNSFWSFAELLGMEIGIDNSFIAITLSASLLISVVGSLLAAWLGGRVDRIKPIVIGVTLTAVSVLLIMHSPAHWLFFFCINLFNFGYNFIIPFQSGWVASLDYSGKNIVMLPAIQGFGISLGPIAAGWLIDNHGYSGMVWFSAVALLVSAVLFVVLRRLQIGETLLTERNSALA